MTEFEDEYSATIEGEIREIKGALFNDTITVLSPAEPMCFAETASVHDAIQAMLARRQASVLIVDRDGRLVGIFTERDVLMRVAAKGLDVRQTQLATVMTRGPEALGLDHRIAYAVHCMSVAGYRTIPLVDEARRPIGIVTVSDVIRWLANLFPEAVLNLPPGDMVRHPGDVDAG